MSRARHTKGRHPAVQDDLGTWSPTSGAREAGHTTYELSNHLGNVLAGVSDLLAPPAQSGEAPRAQVQFARDYYPFGAAIESRTYVQGFEASAGGVEYRYGFNGKEDDGALAGVSDGVLQDYGFRIYSPAMGRFLSVDPLAPNYPMLTPYQFASNTPVQAIDLDGLEAVAIAGQGDWFGSDENNAFYARAYWLGKRFGHTVVSVSNGAELIRAFETETENAVYVRTGVIFSHGQSNAILLDWDNGLYSTGTAFSASEPGRMATVSDFEAAVDRGDILFARDASLILGSCNGCSGGNTTTSIAGELSDALGIRVIAATTNVKPEIVDGEETARLIAESYGGERGSFLSIRTVFDYTVTTADGISVSGTANSLIEAEAFIEGFAPEEGASSEINERQEVLDLGDTIDPSQL